MKQRGFIILALVLLVLPGCAQPSTAPTPADKAAGTPAPTVLPAATPATVPPAPAPAPTPVSKPAPGSRPTVDSTPPPAIAGLVAVDAYDHRVNLWWNGSTAGDFDHYNVYLNNTDVKDVIAMKAIKQIGDIGTCRYQVTGLDYGTKYYFAVTAVDKSGNEDVKAAVVSASPAPMPKGTKAPDMNADIYQRDRVWAGTTLLADNHNRDKPRIIEVNMLGEIVWEHPVPAELKRYNNPGFDVELLPNGHVLYVLPGNGAYEIDRSGKTVWSYLTTKISHDADRLPDGNTIFAFGNNDQKSDAQVTEIDPKGQVVWTWQAKSHFDKPPFDSIFNQGWTHANAVSRLANGNTLVSLRNFNLVAEVDRKGEVVRTYGEGVFANQHDPEVLANGHMLLANHGRPHRAIEFDTGKGMVVWQSAGFAQNAVPVRDANRLPNGNTLITGTTEVIEVTPQNEIVWRFKLEGVSFAQQEAPGLGFYKAERISPRK